MCFEIYHVVFVQEKVDHVLKCGFFIDLKSYKKEKSIELLFDYPHKSTFFTSSY
jgi:hypothetical protein